AIWVDWCRFASPPPVSRHLRRINQRSENCRMARRSTVRRVEELILFEDSRFTDPPYNVPIDGHASGLGAIHHRPFPMAAGEMDKAAFTAFLGQACRNLAACSAGGSLHFICMDWRHLGELLAAGAEAYGELKNLCIWVKNNAGMGSLYRSQHELVLVFKQRGGAHRNNVQLGQFGRNRSNVWHY